MLNKKLDNACLLPSLPIQNSSDLNNAPKTNIYQNLCAQYYELDKPQAPNDALSFYLSCAYEAKGPILEPMCGSGRFFVPLLKHGFNVTGFDFSPHMLRMCQRKSEEAGVSGLLLEASFETFISDILYKLIIIPSGSFCLLTQAQDIDQALKTVFKYLDPGGKFVFEIDTLNAVNKEQNLWNKSLVNIGEGTSLVLNTKSTFEPKTAIETTLCCYEKWVKNKVVEAEEESFRIKLYTMKEIETLLDQYNLKVTNKWLPYTKYKPHSLAVSVVYECIKKESNE